MNGAIVMKKTLNAMVCALLLITAVVACQPATEAEVQASNPATTASNGGSMDSQNESAELRQLYQDIQQLVGKAEATELAQCRKVGFGYRSCGGPDSYLVYSVLGLDEATLLQKVSRYNALSQAEAERLGLMSTCQVIAEPAITLVSGVCQAVEAEASGDITQ
jgi:hypothetical protein